MLKTKTISSEIWMSIAAMMCLFTFLSQPALSHEITPSLIKLESQDSQNLSIKLTTNLEAILADVGTEHDDTDQSANTVFYDELRSRSSADLISEFKKIETDFVKSIVLSNNNGVLSVQLKDIDVPDIGDIDLARDSNLMLSVQSDTDLDAINFQWPAKYGDVILRRIIPGASAEDGKNGLDAYYIKAGDVSADIALGSTAGRSFWETAVEYVVIGFEHILPKGLDHILFVIGLFLLSTRLKALLWQVTAFTIAHSITLALGLLGIVTISPDIVEPLIALSIAVICLENILTSKLNIWRPILVFGFGLLHGLGFAGVLSEIGLAQSDFALGLISFNIGVELGQLTVIAICLALVWTIKDKPWYRQRVVIPTSILIGLIGLYWTIERVFL